MSNNLFLNFKGRERPLAEKWLERLGRSENKGRTSADARAYAGFLKLLLEPLYAGKKVPEPLEQDPGFSRSLLDSYTGLFGETADRAYLSGLKSLARVVDEAVGGTRASQQEKFKALALFRNHFDKVEKFLIDAGIAGLEENLAGKDKQDDRLSAIIESKKLFDALFQTAKNGVLLVNKDFKIIGANKAGSEIFGRTAMEMAGKNLRLLIADSSSRDLESAITRLAQESRSFSGELTGINSGGSVFPMDMTMSRVDLADKNLYLVIIRDLSGIRKLERGLKLEKAQVEDMSVTLKNVMRTIDREKESFKQELARRIETELIPALEKMVAEPSSEVRKSYHSVLKTRLYNLAQGRSDDVEGRLLDLTPTEMEICRYIMAGSSTKEIAEFMNSAFETIQTHRKNIRKKLGLKGKKMTLQAYLKSRKFNVESSTGR